MSFTTRRAREQLEAYRKLDPSIPDKPEYARMGVGGMHSLMTPLIYVAEDGETAQGMWHSPGQITFSEPGGDGLPEGHCMWMYERYAVDFIKENGEWKIWHLLIGTDTAMPVGGCITDEIIDLERPAPAAEAGEDPYAMELTFTFPAYDSRFNWPEYPPLPKPYRTFSETVSYGPEGNPLYGGQK